MAFDCQETTLVSRSSSRHSCADCLNNGPIRKVQSYNSENASDYLKVALAAADKAAGISRSYFAGNFTVTTKSDMTPVTQADVECEEAIRNIILSIVSTMIVTGSTAAWTM